MDNFFIFALCVVFAVVYGLVLFKLGQSNKKHRKTLFYALAFLPIVLQIFLFISVLMKVVLTITIIQIYWWAFILLFIEKYFWITSLKTSSEEDTMFWFYIILYVPILGWIFYRITRIR